MKCSGKCNGLSEPLLCKGGKIECGCNVDTACQGLCEASINAKAACEQQAEVTITVSGGMQPKHVKLKATLDKYYSRVFEIEFKVKALGSAAGNLTASIAGMTDVKVACMLNIMAIAKDIGSSFTSTVKIVSSLEATLS